jgi:hypothetical protein
MNDIHDPILIVNTTKLITNVAFGFVNSMLLTDGLYWSGSNLPVLLHSYSGAEYGNSTPFY